MSQDMTAVFSLGKQCKKKHPERKPQPIYIISEWTSHHFWDIFFARNETVNPIHTQRRGLHNGIAYLGVSKTSFRFDKLLRLTKFAESYYSHGYKLLQQKERDQNHPREEAYKAVSRRQCNFKCRESSLPFPVELYRYRLLLTATICDNTHVTPPTEEFVLGLNHVNLVACLANLNL